MDDFLQAYSEIDNFGRVTISKDDREAIFGKPLKILRKDKNGNAIIKNVTPVKLIIKKDEVIIRRSDEMTGCIFCGSIDELIDFKGKILCSSCLKELQKTKSGS